ncbi:hypothetical protein GCM10020358_70900 [Amorphoplanes nipponensis]|uniref:Uncharacterized protein n=1 Tax=Actinoplanes nipponensis TaxID=135950 RepID=A0A919MJ59_9ACTN|nr:hypothetical protein [Actinoplanes nipponensis]GIE47121.1 hypothetical protein Ani05nite_06550 [Actinoplanes nipponensis]
MRSWRTRHRPRATVPAGLLLGLVVGLTACGAGGEAPSDLPSTRASQRAGDRTPAPTRTAEAEEPAPTRTTDAEEPAPTRTTDVEEPTRAPTTTAATPDRTRTTRPTPPAAATTRPPAATEPTPDRTTQTTVPAPTTTAAEPAPTPASSASAVAAVDTTGGLGLFGWLLLFALFAGLIVAWVLVARSQRRSGWDTEARALESETRAITVTRLPPALRTTTIGRRSLVWPQVRADLVDVRSRWSALADRASGEARQNWSLRVAAMLHELITAIDTESEALATEQDWTTLRVRVQQAYRALDAVLTGQPRPEPPPAAEPGPSASPA